MVKLLDYKCQENNLYTAYYILHAAYYVLHTAYYVLYTAYAYFLYLEKRKLDRRIFPENKTKQNKKGVLEGHDSILRFVCLNILGILI